MQVIDHQPAAWFLLQEGNEYFLDVSCERGAVGFSVTIRLAEEERKLYAGGGHAYVMELGEQIFNKSAPGDPRAIRDPALGQRIHHAIMSWKEN